MRPFQLIALPLLLALAACDSKPSAEDQARQAAAIPRSEPAADVCDFLDVETVATLLGHAVKTEAKPRMGSQWGGCDYTSADEVTAANMGSVKTLGVSIRPATEFDGTLDYHRTRSAVQAVPDLVGTAYTDAQMLLWQPPAKPWFVVVMVNQSGSFDTSLAVDAARKIRF